MKEQYHIIVEEGSEAGMKITIPENGARLGRSSKNDFSLVDPLLSRHHCRIFFKDGGLWITDLGSANETFINDEKIDEAPIHRDDLITIGDTVLRVVDDGRPQIQITTPAETIVDLGLNSSPGEMQGANGKKANLTPLLTALFAVIIIAGAGMIMKKMISKPAPAIKVPTATEQKKDQTLTVDYEKIEASPENIFYYHLTITPDGVLAISIDDLQNNRSVREEKRVDKGLIEDLTDFLEQSGFFDLHDSYEGINPKTLDQYTIGITVGKQSKQVTISNRIEPDIFMRVREKLEDFGQVELGIWAIQFSTEKLLEMANNAYLLGKKQYAERMVAMGNLAAAIKSFKEAEWYLETVEQKPDFYADILASKRACTEELDKNYEEHNFRTERAIRLREWRTAASELRKLLELIPDRTDKRNIDARKKLEEVDARMEKEK